MSLTVTSPHGSYHKNIAVSIIGEVLKEILKIIGRAIVRCHHVHARAKLHVTENCCTRTCAPVPLHRENEKLNLDPHEIIDEHESTNSESATHVCALFGPILLEKKILDPSGILEAFGQQTFCHFS